VSSSDPPRRALARWLRALVLVIAGAPRVWGAFADQGLFWPDEFYQTTEQAHRFAFGYGIVPWEFVSGARSWLFPGAIGLLWKAMAAVGVKSAPALMITAKLAMAAAAVAAVELAMRFARRFAGDGAAILAGAMVATFPALVLFGTKCMTETASAPLVLGAALLTCAAEGEGAPSSRRARGAGALAALAIYLRYQNGVVALSLLAILAAQRRFRDAAHYAAAAFVVGLAGGVLDLVTWGGLFHSFIEYAKFHAAGGSAPWGSADASYYVFYTWESCGPAIAVAAVGFVAASRRAPGYVATVALVVVTHTLVPHKEYRFITPVIPLFVALAAIGIADLVARVARSRRDAALVALAAAVAVAFAIRAATMTFRDLGHGDGLAAGLAGPDDSPWHAAEGINRMLWAAGARGDTCGVVVRDIPWSSTGGFAYLHRDVPLLFHLDRDAMRVANYLVARRELNPPASYVQVAESRGFALFRRPGPCARPPASYTRVVPP